MITLGILAVVGLWIGISITNKARNPDWVGGLFLTFFVTLIGLTAVVLVPMNIGAVIWTDHDKAEYTGSFSIIAAADGSLTEGSFFIFGGQIEETPMYFFYRQDSNTGAIKQGHIPVNKTVIYEDQENKGYVDIYRDEHYFGDWYWAISNNSEAKYEIHVPKGSVVRQFDFDLEK